MTPSRVTSPPAVAELTWPGVLAWRVRRQGLARRVPVGEALGVVRRIAGLHAQLLSSAELTLHARVEGLDGDFVERALWTDKTLVKTWAMRGTLHLVPADELPAYVGAQAAIPPRHQQGASTFRGNVSGSASIHTETLSDDCTLIGDFKARRR